MVFAPGANTSRVLQPVGDSDNAQIEARELWLPIMKSILSVVPAPKENPQSGKDPGRALPIEFVELSRTESYGY